MGVCTGFAFAVLYFSEQIMAQAAAMARAQVAGAAGSGGLYQGFGAFGGQPVMDDKTRKTMTEIFVGNLPPSCNGALLMEFLNAALLEVKLNQAPGAPIVEQRHTPGAKFAFVVFRTAEEATAALNVNGIPYLGAMVSYHAQTNFQNLLYRTPRDLVLAYEYDGVRVARCWFASRF